MYCTNNPKELPLMLTAKEAAHVANVDVRTIHRMCAAGTLKAVKVRSTWRVNRDALLAYLGIE